MQARLNQFSTITVRQLQETDLLSADALFRLAFGTFLNYPDPARFCAETSYIVPRWHKDPTSVFGAEYQNVVIGTNVASNWGSAGFLGPLSIHPTFWNKKIGQMLMEPVLACFERWDTSHAGLSTFPQSSKHIYFYQKFGFWPRSLSILLARSLPVGHQAPAPLPSNCVIYSALPATERSQHLAASFELTDALCAGLDLRGEITSIYEQQLGETLLLYHDSLLQGLALCHYGKGSEAQAHTCHIKFGAVLSGPQNFDQLLFACETLAGRVGAFHLTASVDVARHSAYRQLLARAFKLTSQSVLMQQDKTSSYTRPDLWLIDDWR